MSHAARLASGSGRGVTLSAWHIAEPEQIIGVMGSKRTDEEWTEADLDMLLHVAVSSMRESQACHDAGCPLAALVMLASSFEASLLGMIVAHEDWLRSEALWPAGTSHLHLTELVNIAAKTNWLTSDKVWHVTEILNKARTMAAHPGAYVRAMRQMPHDYALDAPEGYDVCFQIVQQAGSQLRTANTAFAQAKTLRA